MGMSKIATYTGANGYSDAGFIDVTGAKGLQNFNPNAATDTLAADISAAGKQELFEIILAVNYLNIKSLLHLGCAKIATVIKGQGPDIIKRILGDNDYGVIGGVPVQGARRRRLSKDDRSILSKMFGTTF